jgi:alanine dehydrogenase
MKIGCVKEIKNNEFRVGLTPDNVKAYVAAGHHVYMEKGAGIGSGFSDNEYVDAGASLIENAADVWHLVDMMVKVVDSIAIFGILSIPIFRIGKDMGFPPFEKRYFLNVIEFSGLVITG